MVALLQLPQVVAPPTLQIATPVLSVIKNLVEQLASLLQKDDSAITSNNDDDNIKDIIYIKDMKDMKDIKDMLDPLDPLDPLDSLDFERSIIA
ncbi:hypothetical protein C2G38_2160741 [Gigaspora rosea]|uniref:Uncharacterized protein n=1 Tax=Gigaspora rosea TaxID=44941 RepID=A0A397VXW7_9GLOM|nr:hypothetical protein C2G38_2160741 [Gigaspora rosea]